MKNFPDNKAYHTHFEKSMKRGFLFVHSKAKCFLQAKTFVYLKVLTYNGAVARIDREAALLTERLNIYAIRNT